jgi:glycosyltransferase involved in cell wall biosynthesis
MKKLAVLLPTFNAALYIKESIDSILDQTFTNWDLYIYDDCSTDNTAEIVSSYSDPRIFYRKNKENSGIAKTLNKGLDELLPSYEFIARMDADDWAYPQRFEKQLDVLGNQGEIIVCGTQGYWVQDINQNPSAGWEYPIDNEYIKYYLLFAATFGHSSIILRSHDFIENRLRYDETITTCEDWELWVRVSKIGKMTNVPDFLMKYRILEYSNHRSPEKIEKHFEERSKIISEYWKYFNVLISSQEVYDLYFSKKEVSKKEFYIKIKKVITAFNVIYYHSLDQHLSLKDSSDFSYMMSRKILNYWKRSGVSRLSALSWFFILNEVKFMNKVKLVKSIIR